MYKSYDIYTCIFAIIYIYVIERFFKLLYNSSSSLIADMFRPSGTPQYNQRFMYIGMCISTEYFTCATPRPCSYVSLKMSLYVSLCCCN